MSGVEFPVRVALPADGEGGWRDDLERELVAGAPDEYGNRRVFWKVGGDDMHASVGEYAFPALLKALNIIDVTERGKAGEWEDCGDLGEKYGESRVIVGTKDDAGTKASVMGDWNVWAGGAIVAQGTAPSLNEAKAAADHYAAMLYELDGGAFVVPVVEDADTRLMDAAADAEWAKMEAEEQLQRWVSWAHHHGRATGTRPSDDELRANITALIEWSRDAIDAAVALDRLANDDGTRISLAELAVDGSALPPSTTAIDLLGEAFTIMGQGGTWAEGIDPNAGDSWWNRVCELTNAAEPAEPPALPLAGVVFDGGWVGRSTGCLMVAELGCELRVSIVASDMSSWAVVAHGITVSHGQVNSPWQAMKAAEASARDLGATVRGGE